MFSDYDIIGVNNAPAFMKLGASIKVVVASTSLLAMSGGGGGFNGNYPGGSGMYGVEVYAGTSFIRMATDPSGASDAEINLNNGAIQLRGSDGKLTATNAFVRGDVQATSINAGAVNVVGTLQLQGNAVTVPSYAEASSGIITLTSTWVTAASTSVVVSGMATGQTAGTIVTGTAALYENGGAGATIAAGLFVNGTQVGGVACTLGDSKTLSGSALVQLANGTHAVDLRLRVDTTRGASTKSLSYDSYLVVMSGKR